MNRLFYYIGNTLIVISLAGFAFTFYPLIAVYFSPSSLVKAEELPDGTYISIPKIKAQAKVFENVDPWNQTSYNEILKKGVAHAKGTAFIGSEGTSFFFAHSSGNPWDLTRMNTIFLRLGELENGDEIEIMKDKKLYRYKVTEKKEVDPTEVNYLLQTKKTQIILQTCTPIGTSLRRLLIFAEPIN